MKRFTHVPSLDALRGIAALAVVLVHLGVSYRDLGYPTGLASRLVHGLIWFGHPAVVLFFVLSGVVLQLSYSTAAGHHYGHYLIRRFMRIFPAVIASLILAAVLPRPPVNDFFGPWFNQADGADLSLVSWVRNALVLMLKSDDMGFNPVLWSLAYEWRFSLVFPFLAILCVRTPMIMGALVIPVFYLARSALNSRGLHDPFLTGVDIPSAVLMTILYMPIFVVGMLLAQAHLRFGSVKRRLSIWAEVVWLAACPIPYLLLKNDMGLTLSAAILIGLLMSAVVLPRVMMTAPLMWLGRVSFSLYLLHFPLMLAFVSLWPQIGVWALPLTLVASLVLADFCYRTIEKPSIAIGKRLGSLVVARRVEDRAVVDDRKATSVLDQSPS